ncbi:hypothetical protein B0T21DRAFT_377637 [Apiosordaria backusii]|uniref:Secreted protein n=1 Tax=Apiosordaria backusii TaxID=314023 RepID=A0AA40DM25_9PEZI|nr:hypothetical protein B0T21DRAFT_377637 [Apiosordaria backusii]
MMWHPVGRIGFLYLVFLFPEGITDPVPELGAECKTEPGIGVCAVLERLPCSFSAAGVGSPCQRQGLESLDADFVQRLFGNGGKSATRAGERVEGGKGVGRRLEIARFIADLDENLVRQAREGGHLDGNNWELWSCHTDSKTAEQSWRGKQVV